MMDIKVKTLKNYLQCPKCGEFHEFFEDLPTKKIVCLYCDEIFNADDFQPYAITFKKTEL